MKKTIITLMALAGVVSADTFTMSDLVSSGTLGEGVSQDVSYADTVYTFTNKGAITEITNSELLDAFKATSGYITIAAWVNQTEGSEDAIFSVGGQNDGLKFALKDDCLQVTTKGTKDTTTSLAVTQGNTTTPAWTLVAVTISLDSAGTSTFFTGSNGYTSLSSEDKSIGGWTTPSNNYFAIGSGNGNGNRDLFEGQIANLTIITSSTAATADSIKTLMGNTAPKLVPEPTTATLSLLALAGLAARRRRR